MSMQYDNETLRPVSERPTAKNYEGEEALTKQEFKDECDINIIMRRYKKTGDLTHVRDHLGTGGDFSQVNDFQMSLNMLIDAQDQFDRLPAELRKHCDHDPAVFIDWVDNPENLQEAIRLGIFPRDTPLPESTPEKAAGPPPEPPETTPEPGSD